MQELIVYSIVALAACVVFRRYVLQIVRRSNSTATAGDVGVAELSETSSYESICGNCSGCDSGKNAAECRITFIKRN